MYNFKDLTQEKIYKRNFITYMLESFLFSFSLSVFSHTTVLPMYVKNLTTNSFFIGLISLIFFSMSNISSLFSSILVYNSLDIKGVAIKICFLQRIGLLFIYISTFWAGKNQSTALIIFFVAYTFYSITSGMSAPAFSNLVSKAIYKDVSLFYGMYGLSGALSGFLGSFFVNKVLKSKTFPGNFKILFFLALITALIATLVLVLGVKVNIKKEKTNRKMTFKELPDEFAKILTTNKEYRTFLFLRVVTSVSEVILPFYILKVSQVTANDSLSGLMNIFLLSTTFFAGRYIGKIGDRRGVIYVLKLAAYSSVCASVLVLLINRTFYFPLVFVCIGIYTISLQIATNVANIEYAEKNKVPIYTSLTGISIAPFFVIISFFVSLMVKKIGINFVFYFSLIVNVFVLFVIRIVGDTDDQKRTP